MCPHCDELYDADTHVEHEEMCKEDTEDEKRAHDKTMRSNIDRMFDDSIKQLDSLVKQAKDITNKYKKQ